METSRLENKTPPTGEEETTIPIRAEETFPRKRFDVKQDDGEEEETQAEQEDDNNKLTVQYHC